MLILASKSPRRKTLLSLISEDFCIKSAEVDETLPEGASPREAVEYLSKIKALPFQDENNIVIGADTVVSADGVILGKPKDETEALSMLRFLSGREHAVFTGVTVIKGTRQVTFSQETKVKFFDLTDEEIRAYIATGEPFDKAGGYGIQGKGALLVEKIDGDYFNVVGLPVSNLNKVLKDFFSDFTLK